VDFGAFREHRKIRQAIAHVVPGMEALADIDVARREFHIGQRLLHTPEFKTADRRARFRVAGIPNPDAIGTNDAFPFTLMTVRSEGQFNTIIYEENDSYRPAQNRWSVMMNGEDMRRLGLDEGQEADMRSPHGSMEAIRVHAFDLPAGNAMAYFPEANVLIGRAIDPRSKTPGFKSVPVSIRASHHGNA
jgi:anaerobic selenocysteine-containing dehydrogenase